MDNKENRLVCIGKITTAHGIRGEVVIYSHMEDPESILDFDTILDRSGKREFQITARSINQKKIIAHIEGVDTRQQAEMLRHTELYVPRSDLPEIDETDVFYIEDLKGLKVINVADGTDYAIIKDAYNYGAGDILSLVTIADEKEEIYSFTKDIFPDIDLEKGYVSIIRPVTDYVQDLEQIDKTES